MARPKGSYAHGTPQRYGQGCRCEECRAARAAVQRARVAANRNKSTPDHVHGINGYSNYACRCSVCAGAWADYCYGQKSVRSTRQPPKHGTENGYTNYNCRCDACRAAHTATAARKRAARKQATSP